MELNSIQLDAIKEIVNMGTGKAGSILNQMFNTRVLLKVPNIRIVSVDNLNSEFADLSNDLISIVNLDFSGNFSGTAKLIFPTDSASKLVKYFAEEETEDDELDEIRSATLSEIGNIVLNSLMGTISNTLELMLNYSIPTYNEDKNFNIISKSVIEMEPYCFLAHTQFKLEELSIKGDFILVFEIGSLNEFIALVDDYISYLEND